MIVLSLGVLAVCLVLLPPLSAISDSATGADIALASGAGLQKATLEILDTKCNACHRRQNPFMVFNERNMVRRAARIYKAVFLERKMPKGTKVKLTSEEYATLEKWLFTQEIF